MIISIQNLKNELERMSHDRIYTGKERIELYDAVQNSINRLYLQKKHETYKAIGEARRKQDK